MPSVQTQTAQAAPRVFYSVGILFYRGRLSLEKPPDKAAQNCAFEPQAGEQSRSSSGLRLFPKPTN